MFELTVRFLSSIEPFTILLALLPLIGYLSVFSLLRLSGKVLVTTGGRDVAALAIAVSGMIAIGPAELFFPRSAAAVFGPVVWFALGSFYGLSVSLIALAMPPKLVVYGRTPEELFEPLLVSARRIDPAAAGNAHTLQVSLPTLSIHLRLDGQPGFDHARVIAFEPNVPLKFWNQLLATLRAEAHQQPIPMPRRGFGMLIVASFLSLILIWQSFSNQALVVEGFRDWLWR
jgi:hypothetical protein